MATHTCLCGKNAGDPHNQVGSAAFGEWVPCGPGSLAAGTMKGPTWGRVGEEFRIF